MTPDDPSSPAAHATLLNRHLRFGWWWLLIFLTLGLGLETMHGFKIGWYLDPSNETRRLMWTLAHAHGVLLALINIAFAGTIRMRPDMVLRGGKLAAGCLIGAAILLPFGFFLGGLFLYGGDPGMGIFLVPAGAVLLFLAVLITARNVTRRAE